MQATVFLDRDNTLIANDGDLGDPDAVQLLDGVASGLKALRRAGYGLVVVSNQGGVARGAFSEDDVDAVHQRIAELVDEAAGESDHERHVISRFYYCPYHPKATIDEYRRDHPWRKPHPGMLRQAARDLNLDLARCWMVGDQPRDVEAGRSAGCRTVLLTREPDLARSVKPTVSVRTFPEAVQAILRDSSQPGPPGGQTPAPGRAAAAPPPERTAASPVRDSIPASTRSDAPDASPGETPETPRASGRSNDSTGSAPRTRTHRTEKSWAGDDADRLRRVIEELADVVRSDQQRRVEFTGFRLAAGMCQLLVVLLALLGLLQLGATDQYVKWMIGAVLVQLLTISLLLLDPKG